MINTMSAKQKQTRKNISLRYIVVLLLVLTPFVVISDIRFLRRASVRRHIESGILDMHAHNLGGAEREWRTALKTDPTQPGPYRLLASLYMHTGYPGSAIPLLARLHQIDPKTHHTLARLAEAYALTNQGAKSLATARQAVVAEPESARAHAILGIDLGNVQDEAGAISELSKAAALAPNNDKIAISLAQAQLDAADLVGAQHTAQSVIAHNPKYATAYYVLGWSYSRRTPTPNNVHQASLAFEKAVKLDPSRLDALAELGRLRVQTGDHRDAIVLLQRAWKQGMQTEEVAYNLAEAYRQAGDTAQANTMRAQFKRISDYDSRYAALRKALAVAPDKGPIALQLAELDMQARHYQQALPLVQGALQARSDNLQALQYAVKIYTSLGDIQAAAFYRSRIGALKQLESEERP